MTMITDDATEVCFGWRPFDRDANHVYCHNYLCVNHAPLSLLASLKPFLIKARKVHKERGLSNGRGKKKKKEKKKRRRRKSPQLK